MNKKTVSIFRVIRETELRMIKEFNSRISEYIASFDGGENKKIFDFYDPSFKTVDWERGHRDGKYAMFNKFKYDLKQINLALAKIFIDKYHEDILKELGIEVKDD
jgi:hypothetical protein